MTSIKIYNILKDIKFQLFSYNSFKLFWIYYNFYNSGSNFHKNLKNSLLFWIFYWNLIKIWFWIKMEQIFITLFVTNSYFWSITSEIESSFVCSATNGKFEHYICSKYWHCANNIPHEVDCEKPLLWNDFYKVCDWSQNVICPTPTTIPPTTTSTTTTLPPIISTKETTIQTPPKEELTTTEEITASEEETTTEESTTADSQSTQATTTTICTATPKQENQCSGANHLHRIDDCTKF